MERRKGTRRILVPLIASLALVAVACEGGAEEGAPSGEIDEVTWALPDIPDVLLVPHDWTTYQGAVMSLVEEGMLAFGDDLQLIPALAESWEQVDDTTYVFTLREGVTFHDGSPLTPEDVVYSITWHLDPDNASQLAAFFRSVEAVEATGEREVTVRLKNPDAQFLYSLAHMAGFVMKKDQLEANPETFGTPDVLPLGTGPYRLVEFVPDERIVLERYDGYWGDQGPVRRIVIRPIPDQQTRLLALQNGDIDGTFDVPVSEVDQWERLENARVVTAPSLGVYLFTLDQETPPFDDIHVRRAIAYSVDREGLVQAVLKGKGEAAVAINPPGMWAGVLPEDEVRAFYDTLPSYSFDLEKARQELAQSSVPGGFEATVNVPNTDPLMINAALNLSENLKQIGVTLDVRQVDPGEWLDVYFAHEDLGIQMMAYFPDFADPVNYPYLFLYSGNAVRDGLNGSNYRNPEVDAAIETALRSSDPAERAAALQEAIRIAQEEVAVVPIYWPDSAMAISADLRLDGYNAFWYNIPWAIRGFGPA
ncbi:MAG TPA: ABC transporter substrate-binding protein [Actinomycetota bacterium]|nr:ABC transporter substrate-binding protein [Actinomycetota bacterium]